MRCASSQASPPIGCPAVKSSSAGESLSSMIAASSGPCGKIRRAVVDASGSWALLASHCCRSASVSALGSATLETGSGLGAGWRGAAGVSQSRGCSWTATSTPASSHQASALRASATPIDPKSPPMHYLSPPLTVRSRNWQGGRVELCRRRDEGTMSQRESMQYDVVIVGAGPAGLSAAIRLKQLANEAGPRPFRLRPRKGQRGRRAHPVGRGDRSRSRSTS